MLEIVDMYKKIVENLSYGIILLDEELKVQYANPYIEKILKNGCSDEKIYRDKIYGNIFACIKSLNDNLSCGQSDECYRCSLRQKILAIRDGNNIKNSLSDILSLTRCNGAVIRFRLKGHKIKLEDDNYIVVEIQDAEKEENLIKLFEKMGMWNKKLERVLDNLQDQVCVLDENFNYIYVNDALLNAVGKKKDEVIGKSDYDLVPHDMAKLCIENNRYALENGDFSREEYTNGKWYHTLKGRVEISKGKYGVFGIIKNITEERRKENNYQKKMYTDSLTELYNRNFYEDKAEGIYMESEREEDDFSIIILDIDNFKIINDSRGHYFGDRVLQKVSKIVKTNIRKKDHAIRVGGDEIIILLNATAPIAKQIGKQIIKEVKEIEIDGMKISVSIGIAAKKES
ncbi:MAG: diguanylate cyclase, partial [Fusobacteriaceae bacterium]